MNWISLCNEFIYVTFWNKWTEMNYYLHGILSYWDSPAPVGISRAHFLQSWFCLVNVAFQKGWNAETHDFLWCLSKHWGHPKHPNLTAGAQDQVLPGDKVVLRWIKTRLPKTYSPMKSCSCSRNNHMVQFDEICRPYCIPENPDFGEGEAHVLCRCLENSRQLSNHFFHPGILKDTPAPFLGHINALKLRALYSRWGAFSPPADDQSFKFSSCRCKGHIKPM